MTSFRNVLLTTILVCLLAACDFFSPQPSPQGTNVPAPQGGTPTAAPNATVPGAPPASTFKPGNLATRAQLSKIVQAASATVP